MTKWNRFLDICGNLLKNLNVKYHMYTIVHTLWYDTQKWAEVHFVSTDTAWDFSTT